MEGIWSAENTTPSAIEAGLRQLLKDRYVENPSFVPARVLNMVAVVDREWKGEIANRLDRVGRYHPSRTVICAVEKGRTTLDAWATAVIASQAEGGMALGHETIEIDCGPEHVPHLDTIVDALLVTDLTTLIWAPHRHHQAIDSLLHLCHVVLLDSVEEDDPRGAVERSERLARNSYVVDLAWLRSTPWRERIASTFDPPLWRSSLGEISSVTVRHQPESEVAGALLLGWLSSRLGWSAGSLVARNGAHKGHARARRHEVKLELDSDPHMSVPGLAGVTVETASGMSLSLDRSAGGLAAKRRLRDGRESKWTVLGASRGEAGILGEGIRQALLRDPTYRPALADAGKMLS
jgi:glucose-6-phosphate dehydrogenase assembly protein OpcA